MVLPKPFKKLVSSSVEIDPELSISHVLNSSVLSTC